MSTVSGRSFLMRTERRGGQEEDDGQSRRAAPNRALMSARPDELRRHPVTHNYTTYNNIAQLACIRGYRAFA